MVLRASVLMEIYWSAFAKSGLGLSIAISRRDSKASDQTQDFCGVCYLLHSEAVNLGCCIPGGMPVSVGTTICR